MLRLLVRFFDSFSSSSSRVWGWHWVSGASPVVYHRLEAEEAGIYCLMDLEAEKSEIKVLTGFPLHSVKSSLGPGLLPSGLRFAVVFGIPWLTERSTTLVSSFTFS